MSTLGRPWRRATARRRTHEDRAGLAGARTARAATRAAPLAVLLMLLAAPAGPAAAQRTGERAGNALDRVEELVRLGRAEEARSALAEWWGSAAAGASRRDVQRGLWLRGRLTVDPVQAELDYQRLVVLYPSGTYTAEALFRLAQAAHGRGDEASARSHVAALARDHPSDPVRREAEAWLRGAGPVEPPEARAETRREPPDREGAGPRGDARARDGAPRAGPPRASPGDEGGESRTAAGADGEFSVQLGAFADAERALALLQDVRDAGVDARLVRVVGSRFLHVRVGRFRERPAAAAQLEALERLGFSAAIVRDERAERAVGGSGGR